MRALRGANAARSSTGSTRSSGAGRPTTGRWCPARRSTRWTTTCGSSTYKWAKLTHPNKSKRWIVARYFGAFNTSRRDRWVFGDRDSGAYLLKFAWTKIVRHTMVKGWASPDDPALADYWAERRRRSSPPLDRPALRLLQAQHGRCPLCGDCCCTPTTNHKAPTNGNSGSRSPARRSRKHAITADAEPATPDEPPLPSHPRSLPAPIRRRRQTSPALLHACDASGLA